MSKAEQAALLFLERYESVIYSALTTCAENMEALSTKYTDGVGDAFHEVGQKTREAIAKLEELRETIL